MSGWGGKRAGTGRKPNAETPGGEVGAGEPIDAAPDSTPLEFLLAAMHSPGADMRLRLRAAVAAAQYVHLQKGDGGKKDEAAEAAREAAKGRFAASVPPRLVRSS